MNICLYGASSDKIDEIYLKSAYETGKILGEKGHSLVYGGGSCGVMGNAAKGVKDAGGKVIGIAPEFMNKPGVLFEDCDEFIYTKDMRSRKAKMEELSDGFLCMPGGFGTLEEFFEILTGKLLGLHGKPIALVNINGIFDDIVLQMNKFIDEEFAFPKCANAFYVAASPKEAVDFVEKAPCEYNEEKWKMYNSEKKESSL